MDNNDSTPLHRHCVAAAAAAATLIASLASLSHHFKLIVVLFETPPCDKVVGAPDVAA